MGIFENLWGKRGSPKAKEIRDSTIRAIRDTEKKHEPFYLLLMAISRAANQSKEKIKPLFPKSNSREQAVQMENRVFFQFLFFFLHMVNRSAYAEGFTDNQIEQLQEGICRDIVEAIIDSPEARDPEDVTERARQEFYQKLNSTEMEYATSTKLISKEFKPLSGNSILDKLSRMVSVELG